MMAASSPRTGVFWELRICAGLEYLASVGCCAILYDYAQWVTALQSVLESLID